MKRLLIIGAFSFITLSCTMHGASFFWNPWKQDKKEQQRRAEEFVYLQKVGLEQWEKEQAKEKNQAYLLTPQPRRPLTQQEIAENAQVVRKLSKVIETGIFE